MNHPPKVSNTPPPVTDALVQQVIDEIVRLEGERGNGPFVFSYVAVETGIRNTLAARSNQEATPDLARSILQSDLGLLTDAFDRLTGDEQDEIVERLADAMPVRADRKALEAAWTDFLDSNPDGVTSPEEYPDHALVTFEQVVGIVEAATVQEATRTVGAPDGRATEALKTLHATVALEAIGGTKAKYAQGRRHLAQELLPIVNSLLATTRTVGDAARVLRDFVRDIENGDIFLVDLPPALLSKLRDTFVTSSPDTEESKDA